jgi:hypothetical protein
MATFRGNLLENIKYLEQVVLLWQSEESNQSSLGAGHVREFAAVHPCNSRRRQADFLLATTIYFVSDLFQKLHDTQIAWHPQLLPCKAGSLVLLEVLLWRFRLLQFINYSFSAVLLRTLFKVDLNLSKSSTANAEHRISSTDPWID